MYLRTFPSLLNPVSFLLSRHLDPRALPFSLQVVFLAHLSPSAIPASNPVSSLLGQCTCVYGWLSCCPCLVYFSTVLSMGF